MFFANLLILDRSTLYREQLESSPPPPPLLASGLGDNPNGRRIRFKMGCYGRTINWTLSHFYGTISFYQANFYIQN